MVSVPTIQRKASTAATVHLALCFYVLHKDIDRLASPAQVCSAPIQHPLPDSHALPASLSRCVHFFFLRVSVVCLLCSVKALTASCPPTLSWTIASCPSSTSPLRAGSASWAPLSPLRSLYLPQSSSSRAKTSCAD